MPEERRTELIDESVESSVLDYGNTVLFSSARNEYMIYRIKRLIRRSVWALTRQMEQGDFKPAGYELNSEVVRSTGLIRAKMRTGFMSR
mgnify:FL=1